mgnify:CR=1 FL=1
MSTNKTAGEQLREKLFYSPKNGYERITKAQQEQADDYCVEYKNFLNVGKTERECVTYAQQMLEKEGFKPFRFGDTYRAGDKVYYNNRSRSIVFAIIGKVPMTEGVNIAAAHVDSPRLDLKPAPVYEDSELCLFKTHYYGGIKKYQWTAIPLALHGVIAKKDGTVVNVCLGEQEDEPVFCVTDLLPHLSKAQNTKPLAEAIVGEALNVLIGSCPFCDDKESEKVKLNILNLLYEKYDIIEEDFLSADLCMVPAYKAQDVGFDRSMIGSYGHDDHVCAYPVLTGLLATHGEGKTVIGVLTDREEIGSSGNTGLKADYLKNFITELCQGSGVNVRECLRNSKCLSADVNAAFDPNYPDVFEKRNTTKLNYGTIIMKYSGSGGKYDTNDANAEFLGEVRKILDENQVIWQSGELGKVDAGGGGTVAKYVAAMDIDVVDLGVGVLSMHAPFEVVSKLDVYMTHRAIECFLNQA